METRKDRNAQIKYMLTHKKEYLKNITEKEFEKRLQLLREPL